MEQLFNDIGRKTYAVTRPAKRFAAYIEKYEASRAYISECGALALYCNPDRLVALFPPGEWLDMKPVEDDAETPEEPAGPQPREVLFPTTEPSRPPEEIRQAVLDTMSEAREAKTS